MVRWEEEAKARGFRSPRALLHHWIWVEWKTYREVAVLVGLWTTNPIVSALKRYAVKQPPPGNRFRRGMRKAP